jgi:hypothetical protein
LEDYGRVHDLQSKQPAHLTVSGVIDSTDKHTDFFTISILQPLLDIMCDSPSNIKTVLGMSDMPLNKPLSILLQQLKPMFFLIFQINH